jgi:hypothetical protein
VPTAVLLTGVNSPDHAAMFRTLAAHIEADLTEHVVVRLVVFSISARGSPNPDSVLAFPFRADFPIPS